MSGIYNRTQAIIIFLAALFWGCDEKEINPGESKFDRAVMLQHVADELIIPAFDQLLNKTDSLQLSFSNLLHHTDQQHLEAAQQSWTNAYGAWQQANAFNFGPAGESGTRKTLGEEIATFPVSEEKINQILQTGVYNLQDFNRDARGFLALEFFLFDIEKNQDRVLQKLKNIHAQQYAGQLIVHLKDRISAVCQAWKTGYRFEFIQNKGSDAGSSTAMLFNGFVHSFETIKNYKLALPMGKRPGQLYPEPNLAEARFSGQSVLFLDDNFRAIEKIWHGQSFRNETDGIGFKEYLESVEGGPNLISLTLSQMESCKNAILDIPRERPYSQLLTGNDPSLEKAVTELQKQTRYFKSDMSSLLGIAITYASGDGD